jgi:hypothetical protein
VANPLYYVEKDNVWRSMRPPEWLSYVEGMLTHCRRHKPPPKFEAFGKPVYGRPSRVRVAVMPSGVRKYWPTAQHLLVRSTTEWGMADWDYEFQQTAQLCHPDEVSPGPDIFELIRGSVASR